MEMKKQRTGTTIESESVSNNNNPTGDFNSKKKMENVLVGLTKTELVRIDPKSVRRTLKEIVQKLTDQVKEDWHDGYEEQLETKVEWFYALEEPLQAVLDIGVNKSEALVECNEILKIVSDSFNALLACNCRCDDDLGEAGETFELVLPWKNSNSGDATYTASSDSLSEIWTYVWIALLRVHSTKDRSSNTSSSRSCSNKELLFCCIKDMQDNTSQGDKRSSLSGSILFDNNKYCDEREAEFAEMEYAPSRIDLDKLIQGEEDEWKNLPTTKKVHKMKHVIDHRFDDDHNNDDNETHF